MTAHVELRGIVKRFGAVRALRGVDLAIGRGESVAILGGNGAGKSTLLRLVAGLARATAGEVLVDGRASSRDPAQHRAKLGYVSHNTMLQESLTARENLTFAGRLHGVSSLRSRVDQLVRGLGLDARADEPVRQLSRGLQQRVAVARALLHDPELVLLDEPHAGLDVQSSQALGTLLSSVKRRGRTVLLVTHDLQRALELCERVVVLRDGRLAHDVKASGLDLASLVTLAGGQAA